MKVMSLDVFSLKMIKLINILVLFVSTRYRFVAYLF
jgi:hypothetical protein